MADIAITAANVKRVDTTSQAGKYGATIAQGKAVYLDPADNKWKLADANGASVDIRRCQGIALTSGANDQDCTVAIGGVIDIGATLTVGELYVLSATPGGVAPVADLASGMSPAVIGIGTAANRLQLVLANADVVKP